MTFNPDNQYRCAIIRGRTKNEMDNLLPAYAQILGKICPCRRADFKEQFDGELKKILHKYDEKTLNNHRTETVGKLFGMYYVDEGEIVQISERTEKLLEDGDQPAFFKDMCYKLQFPSGMDKPQKLLRDVRHNLRIRQCVYVICLLVAAEKANIVLSRGEIAYYVLNALEVLQGKVSPDEVLQAVVKDRSKGIEKKVFAKGKAYSYTHQHINETFNYMELANLLKTEGNFVYLNKGEKATIDFMASSWNMPLFFDVYKYDLNSKSDRSRIYSGWQVAYSKVDKSAAEIFETPLAAIAVQKEDPIIEAIVSGRAADLVKLGDDGEVYVYNLEKERVKSANSKLASKVLFFGKTKGLGFDIQSVRAVPGPKAEYATFIEVKSTKRVTKPGDDSQDSVTLTRNEWVAAEQHKDDYFIYRVYFTPEKVFVYRIADPVSKSREGVIAVTPLFYRVDFLVKVCDVVS
jgi:hypothetical protein